ncbi:MAG: VPDSG-CTERM sorting domain-containing protein [Opitutaceae bacterium]|nr:VPDSG-CTERM sorting domain-containing protein [Opitutaceae bacterium]
MKTALLKKLSVTLGLAAILVSVNTASAVPFVYDVNSQGTFQGITAGNNPFAGFYKFDVPATESGSASSTFATVISNSGLTATITWSGAQPTLNSIILKASNNYGTWDISNFNSNVYTSIVITNGTVLTGSGNVAEISHVEFSGSLTPKPPGATGVPDGGSTLLMLGLGLMGLAVAMRRRS